MKKLVLTAALLTAIASPAFAKNKTQAATPVINSQTVIASGQILGQDPDATVRLDLARQADSAWTGG
jgi:hypothetical protein